MGIFKEMKFLRAQTNLGLHFFQDPFLAMMTTLKFPRVNMVRFVKYLPEKTPPHFQLSRGSGIFGYQVMTKKITRITLMGNMQNLPRGFHFLKKKQNFGR